MNTVRYGSMSLSFSKLSLFLLLVDLRLDLAIEENKRPNSKFGPTFLFLSFRPCV